MTSLAGIHDREGQAIAPPGTWILDTVALSENPQPTDYVSSFNWVTRLNHGYGSTGTLPVPNEYGVYAQRAADYVAESPGCSRWVIGNEPNLSREWPNGQPIRPWEYAACYMLTRDAIRALPGHERDEVLIAASGPWNNELKYEGNPNGDWITNFEDVIEHCDGEIDGFALHAYTHGYNVALVTSSARMQPPFQHRHYEFRTYRDYMEAIPDSLSHLPVYITEANGNGPWQAVGLMPAMLNEIDNWNQSSAQPIKCVIFYRYPKYDDFHMEGKADVIAEFKAAVARGYTSPVKGNSMNEVFIPVVTPGTSNAQPNLPPRQWDERLTQRGVVIETPPLKPGDRYWRVVKAQWWNEQESQGRHHIYVEAISDGKSMDGVEFEVFWPSGHEFGKTNGRTGFDAGNFPMSKSLSEFGVGVDTEFPTEVVKGIGMGDKGNSGIHTSTGVVFQLTTMPAVTVPAQPQPPTKTTPAYVIAPAGANVRSRPKDGDILIAVPYAQQVDVYDYDAGAPWLLVRYGDVKGWVLATLLSLQPVTVQPTPPPEPPTGDNWTRSIAFVRRWEGGWADNPADPGGATNKGITIGTYTRWREVQGQPQPTKDDLRALTDTEANQIYHEWYWRESGADKLPWPLALAHFDTAVNAGVGKAQEMLQRSNGSFLAYVGHVGIWYTTLSDFPHFGKAWARRRFEILLEASL